MSFINKFLIILNRSKLLVDCIVVFNIISVICAVIWCIINKGGEAPLKEIIYILSHLGIAVLVLIFGGYYNRVFIL